MSEERKPPYEIGFCRPPAAHRFKRGQSGNPKGRPKRMAINLGELLAGQVPARHGDKVRYISPFEGAGRKLLARAVKDRDLPACLEFIKLCEQYGIADLPAAPPHQALQTIPCTWNREEWLEMFAQFGPPPWPGSRSGLAGS
jgi:hypothetical protein